MFFRWEQIWQIFYVFSYFEGLFTYYLEKNGTHVKANFLCNWAKFHSYKWINIEQIIFLSGHIGYLFDNICSRKRMPIYLQVMSVNNRFFCEHSYYFQRSTCYIVIYTHYYPWPAKCDEQGYFYKIIKVWMLLMQSCKRSSRGLYPYTFISPDYWWCSNVIT